ncbi:hypothetical protein [Streptomyces qinzhouensis]|uniref:Uncharacterized protein n=1 Tax=Streptomyces qinzhouensis TaxID=2599401 RepID=A0A5B8JJA9_9ACTN|nr:hypothetical protein [Streptomyces qinzhouensis]QDY77880.1 hypothetical protein FQU76_16765 [Streptomyces qinzhouensis]
MAAGHEWLRHQIVTELRQQTHQLMSTAASDQAAVLRAVADLNERVDAVARNVERVLDALRDQGVRNAIAGGSATSDVHRRHLDLAQDYRRLVRQEVRFLVRLLCPRLDGEGDTDLARRRAETARRLVELLFEPLDQPMARKQEQIVAELRRLGLTTEVPDFQAQFGTAFRKAATLRDAVVGLPHTGHLDFLADVTVLPPDRYEAWDGKQSDGAPPEFLIAPAYVIAGDRPQALTQPIVFVAPVIRPGAGR